MSFRTCQPWLTLVAFLPSFVHFASNLAIATEDKRQLEHEDYAHWSSVSLQAISDDGKWLSFTVSPESGSGSLKIRHIESAKIYDVPRGSSARFTRDSKYVLYTVSPDADQLKKLRDAKTPEELLPKTRLEILNLESGACVEINSVSRFTLPEEASGWVAFQLNNDADASERKPAKSELVETFEVTPEGVQRPEKPKTYREEKQESTSEKQKVATEKKEQGESKSNSADKKKATDKKKQVGSTLVVRNLETHFEQRFPFVGSYRFSEDGKLLAFTTATRSGEGDGVHLLTLSDMKSRTVLSGAGEYGQVVFSKDGKQLAFLTTRDDADAETPKWSAYLSSGSARTAQLVAGPSTKGIPSGWELSSNSAPLFTEDGRRLLFRTRPTPEQSEKSDSESEPKAKLDIWHWQDPFLQPQQLLQANQERNRSYQAVYDLRSRKVFQLATKDIPDVSVDTRSTADVVLGTASAKYNKMRSWDVEGYSDWHLIDLKTGVATHLASMQRGSPSLSPAGKFVVWWDGEKRTWMSLQTDKLASQEGEMSPVDIGSAIGHPLQDELHDTPSLPGPYGTAGWLDEDQAILLYDRWDMWKVDPTGAAKPVCLTDNKGREQQIRFRRVRLDSDERTVDLQTPHLLSAFVHETKASGYYRLSLDKDLKADLNQLIVLDEDIGRLRKAKDADTVAFTRSTFERSPDLWTSTLDFKTMRRMSHANPQQSEYTWGSAELVHWKASDGQALDGLLYKPEGFDENKKYPMLVYFYERNSDNLHTYYPPAAGRSIINFSFYVSRGYVVFVPDIPYVVGEPGPSAANAILPGVEHLVDLGFIDAERIGMQGHSWGGYQTAYLVTQTDMFACAESGAPVSNMTSAYGGIRWGSGMSRMFQYEKTQSRIGATLWEAREKYIENSPLFFADKVNTPLLILHNDEDTAVPWYQGIEMFVALRRLEKPAWMLNYNGDPHWVMSDANRMDFAKRMQQFFDHYLKGDPMPVWMSEGIPAVDKGKEFGFEYVRPEQEPEKEAESP